MNDFLHTIIEDIDSAELLYEELTVADLSGDSAASNHTGPPSASGAGEADRSEDPLLPYLRELSKYPLLSSREEPVLLRQLNDDVASLIDLLASLQPGIDPPADHAGLLQASAQLLRTPLGKKYREPLLWLHQAIKKTRETVINANLRLVVHISKRYWTPLYSMADLVQEGNLGLIRAVEKFDVEKGYRFSTYAYWWIQQRIFRYVSDRWRIIRLPSNVSDDLRVWKRLAAKKNAAPNSPLAAGEESKFAQLDQKYHANPLLSTEHTLSLDRPVATDNPTTLGQTLAGDEAGIEAQAICGDVAEFVHRHIAALSRREQTVIRMRYGIQMPDSYTCREIAQQIGVSVERVRQIEHEAIHKLRCIAAPPSDQPAC